MQGLVLLSLRWQTTQTITDVDFGNKRKWVRLGWGLFRNDDDDDDDDDNDGDDDNNNDDDNDDDGDNDSGALKCRFCILRDLTQVPI